MRAELLGPARHGLASAVVGGLGMALGARLDRALGLAPSCHEGGGLGFATVGMVLGCTAACVWVCGRSGRPRFDFVFHGVTLAGMGSGEEVARAAAGVLGVAAGPGALTLGMAVGTAIGAMAAGLLRAAPRERITFGSEPPGGPVKYGDPETGGP